MDEYNDNVDPMKYLYTPIQNIPSEGSIVEICHNAYSKFQEYNPNILRLGQKAKVVKIKKMIKSRPEGLDLCLCLVKFGDGTYGLYHTTNLRKIK